METAGCGREGVCFMYSPGEPCTCVWGVCGGGIFPQCLSWCSLWLTVGICPLQEVISGKYSDQTHAVYPNVPSSTTSLRHLQRAFLCIECTKSVKPLEPLHYNMYLALSPFIPVLHKCMYWFLMLPMAELTCEGGAGVRAYGVLPWTHRPGPEGAAYQNWAVFCSLAFVYIILPLTLLGEKFHPKMLPTATKQWVRIVCTVCLVFIF